MLGLGPPRAESRGQSSLDRAPTVTRFIMADDSGEIVREAAEAVGFGNVKMIGDTPSMLQTLSIIQGQDAANGWRSINQAIVGKVSESIINMSPGEGAGDATMQALLGKLVQMSPPPTNLPTQGQ